VPGYTGIKAVNSTYVVMAPALAQGGNFATWLTANGTPRVALDALSFHAYGSAGEVNDIVDAASRFCGNHASWCRELWMTANGFASAGSCSVCIGGAKTSTPGNAIWNVVNHFRSAPYLAKYFYFPLQDERNCCDLGLLADDGSPRKGKDCALQEAVAGSRASWCP
jgi:hypothetical protein